MGKIIEKIRGICAVLSVLLHDTKGHLASEAGTSATWLSGTGVMFSRDDSGLEHADLGLGL